MGYLWILIEIYANVTFPFQLQSHKMAKHTQAIHPRQPTNCLSVFGNFCGTGT